MSAFEKWCALVGAHHLPATPLTVAVFISQNAGLAPDLLWAEVAALDQAHEALGYAPPGRSTPALQAFAEAHPVALPRSWRSDERAAFDLLPWPVKQALARRQADLDKAISKIQNDTAIERKKREKDGTPEKIAAA
jgi:hypothetical protein